MRRELSPDAAMASQLLRGMFSQPTSVAPRTVDKPLVIYGAGNLGRMAKAYFDRLGIPVQFVVDANPSGARSDPFWRGTTILGAAECSGENHAGHLLAVCVATSPFFETHDQLVTRGWSDIVPFYDIAEAYRDRHPLSNGWFTGALDEHELQHIERMLSSWADNASRAHHLQFIAWHALREDWLFDDAPVTTSNRYFIPEVSALLHEREAFLDVGAHDGEVVSRFMQHVESRFRTIWAIEPDRDNLSSLRRRIETMHLGDKTDDVHAIGATVGANQESRSFFEGLGYASQLCAYGQRTVDVTTLDQLGLAPTFIKLHLEGAELEALNGAMNTVQTFRPIIAATSYHNNLGLWQLPEWLTANLPDYVFLMRLHGWCGTGSVIYCLPKERLGSH